MKNKILLFSLAFAFAFLTSCSCTKEAFPFAPKHKYGRYPVKKNKPTKNNTAWIYLQWGHEGR